MHHLPVGYAFSQALFRQTASDPQSVEKPPWKGIAYPVNCAAQTHQFAPLTEILAEGSSACGNFLPYYLLVFHISPIDRSFDRNMHMEYDYPSDGFRTTVPAPCCCSCHQKKRYME